MRLKKGTSLLQRKAGEVKRYRQEKKIIPIVMGCIALLTVIVYVISLLYTRFGSFTVQVNKMQNLNYGIALSEHKDGKTTARLDCRASKDITNIDGKVLDDAGLGSIDGEANGKNYMCYTFYCLNTGKEVVDYNFSINIVNMTMDIEAAVRIRLINWKNESFVSQEDFAKAKGVLPSGDPEPEPGTIPFFEKKIVCAKKVTGFAPGEYMKYTVALWLEGNDPECLDNIIGGTFKIGMNFEVISAAVE